VGYLTLAIPRLRQKCPTAVPIMEAARDGVLAFLHFPQEHWCKIWSTNPLERLNKTIKFRTNWVTGPPELAGFGVITLLADRAFPCAELLGWLEKQPGWT
jgi:transposase-like protein